MKRALSASAVPDRRLRRKTSDAEVSAAASSPRRPQTSECSQPSEDDVWDVEYPRSPASLHSDHSRESHSAAAESTVTDDEDHSVPQDVESDSPSEPDPRPKNKKVPLPRPKMPAELCNHAAELPQGPVDMSANRLAIRDAKAARAEKGKGGKGCKVVIKTKAKANTSDSKDVLIEHKVPCPITVEKLHKLLASTVSFDHGPRHGRTQVRNSVQRNKALYQLVHDKTILGQVTAHSYGFQGAVGLATCMAGLYDKGCSKELFNF